MAVAKRNFPIHVIQLLTAPCGFVRVVIMKIGYVLFQGERWWLYRHYLIPSSHFRREVTNKQTYAFIILVVFISGNCQTYPEHNFTSEDEPNIDREQILVLSHSIARVRL